MNYNISGMITMVMKEVGVLDYISSFYGLEFKRYGSNMRTVCPLHADSDPSFSITEGKNAWYCFGCKKGGSVITFVEEMDKVSRIEAVLSIFENMGFNKDEFLEQGDTINTDIFFKAQEYFIDKSKTSKNFKEYLDSKGSGFANICRSRGVGYCDHVDDLVSYLISCGFSQQDIWRYKLDDERITNSVAYPIYNSFGFISYFSYRTFGEIKYMSGAENIPSYIQNLMGGVPTLKSGESVVIVEGENDRLALNSKDINALSMGGTKFNEDMLNFVAAHEIVDLYFWVDGDKAGWKLLNTLFENYGMFCGKGMRAYAIYIQGSDPDSLILSGANIDELIKNALLIPAHQVNDMSGFDALSYSLKFFKQYNSITTEYMIDFLSNKAGVEKDSVRDAVFVQHLEYDAYVEKQILSCILSNPDLIDRNGIESELFELKSSRIVIDQIKSGDRSGVYSQDWVRVFVSKLPNTDQSNFKGLLEKLRELSYNRKLTRAIKNVASSSDSYMDKLSKLNDTMIEIYQGSKIEVEDINESLKRTITRLVSGDITLGFDFGHNWRKLTDVLLGLNPKLLMVLGNTGHGKTNLGLNWIFEWSFIQNLRGFLVSGEMDSDEITNRLIAIATGIPATDILIGNVSDTDMSKIFGIAKAIQSKALMIDTNIEFESIINKIKYMKFKYEIKYVVIDYIQLLTPSTYMKGMSRTLQLKEMARRLKVDICQALKLPVIVLGQLGDQALDESLPQGRRASESKLMQSDADVVIAMRKKTKKEIELDPVGNMILHVDKVRYNKDKVVIPVDFYDTQLLVKEAMIQ